MKREIWQLPSVVRRTDHTESKLLPIVIPFNEIGTSLAFLWRNIITDNGLFSGFKLVNAYTAGRSLRRLLVTSQLKPIIEGHSTSSQHDDSNLVRTDGCFPCNGTRCRVCYYLTTGETFRSSTNNQSFRVRGNISCRTNNVIYLITCKSCQHQYVGQTSRALADRTNDHLSYIRNAKRNTPTGLHFTQPGHSITDFSIMGIEHLPTTSSTLPIIERKWQNLLQTCYPHGINNIKEHLLY
jgi:hypothetical protein